jgi:hypothetical protein
VPALVGVLGLLSRLGALRALALRRLGPNPAGWLRLRAVARLYATRYPEQADTQRTQQNQALHVRSIPHAAAAE